MQVLSRAGVHAMTYTSAVQMIGAGAPAACCYQLQLLVAGLLVGVTPWHPTELSLPLHGTPGMAPPTGM